MTRKRRGRGEGSVFQRKRDGLWCAEVTVGVTETGRRRVKRAYAPTKGEAQGRLMALQRDHAAGLMLETERVTVAEFLNRWLEAAAGTLRATTLARYQLLCRRQIAPAIGGVVFTKLQPLHVQGLLDQLRRGGASPRQQQMVYAALHRACTQGVQWRLIMQNPCDAVGKPRVPKSRAKAFTAEEAAAILRTTKADHWRRWHALYALALSTGLRQGELFALCWDDVHLDAGFITVSHTMEELRGKLSRVETKTKKGRRVDLDGMSVAALRAHRQAALAEGNAPHATALVFCDGRGHPLRKSNFVRRVHRPILAEAGLGYLPFHSTRHTSATLLLMQGVHPKIVQERLGHAQIAMTLDTYSHVLPTMQSEAVRQMDAVWASVHKN